MPEMAQKTVVELIDDIDGSPAEETVRFGLDGIAYEIDLSRKNAARLRDAVAAYVSAGRRRSGRARARRSTVTPVRASSRTIREWAKANNVSVTARGRIPASVVERFNAAYKRSA
jgi:nucleoid-associated protein Lsr2